MYTYYSCSEIAVPVELLVYEEDSETKKTQFVCEQGSNSGFQSTEESVSFPRAMEGIPLF